MTARLKHFKKTWKITHYAWMFVLAFVALFLIIEFRNLALLSSFYSATDSLIETGVFALVMLGGLTTMFSPLGSTLIVLFVLLFSVNMILLYQYIMVQRRITRKTKGSKRSAALSTTGTILATIGIGCASCGTAILFSVLSLVGAGGLLLWLPLHGQEFSILGIAGLLYAIWYILGKLENPYVCEV
jgi:hypothetical protein